jgi:hypothetical protein
MTLNSPGNNSSKEDQTMHEDRIRDGKKITYGTPSKTNTGCRKESLKPWSSGMGDLTAVYNEKKQSSGTPSERSHTLTHHSPLTSPSDQYLS